MSSSVKSLTYRLSCNLFFDFEVLKPIILVFGQKVKVALVTLSSVVLKVLPVLASMIFPAFIWVLNQPRLIFALASMDGVYCALTPKPKALASSPMLFPCRLCRVLGAGSMMPPLIKYQPFFSRPSPPIPLCLTI